MYGLLWALYITVLRALREPNDWAKAQWLISYKFGFVKRALPGTLIDPFLNPANTGYSETVITVISFSLFLVFCGFLFWLCFRLMQKSEFNMTSVSIVLLFLTSPYIVMSSHLNGYFDNIVIIITLIACLFVRQGKILFGAIMLLIGVLIHENTFLIGLPSVIFFAFLKHTKETEFSKPMKIITSFLSRYKFLIIVPLITFACVLINQKILLNSEIVKHQLILHLKKFDFIKNGKDISVPREFTTSFFDYLANQSPEFFDRIKDIRYIIHIGLPLSILLTYGWIKLRGVKNNRLIFLILLFITLLPLTLHLIAWDTSRIWTFPIIVAMLSLWSISEIYPYYESNEKLSISFFLVTVIVIIFQLFIITPLMDYAAETFSNEERILFYSPSLFLFIIFISKKYFIGRYSN